jgi:hypothetical protein
MKAAGEEVFRAVGLRDYFRSRRSRHGGFTETGDAELTDREIMAQGRKATVKTLPKYVKRTTKQIITGTKKRRAARTKTDQDSE